MYSSKIEGKILKEDGFPTHIVFQKEDQVRIEERKLIR